MIAAQGRNWITSWHDRSALLDLTKFSEAPANSDHHPLIAAIAIPFRPIYKHKPQPTLNVRMLTDSLEMTQHYNITIKNNFLVLDDLSEDVEIAWATICDTIHTVAKDIIGYRRSHLIRNRGYPMKQWIQLM